MNAINKLYLTASVPFKYLIPGFFRLPDLITVLAWFILPLRPLAHDFMALAHDSSQQYSLQIERVLTE
jgi:hypothetical protein